MKANELRIGNWVRQRESDTYIQIEQYLLCNEELCHYQPIPLTKEWLLKLGFHKKDAEWYLHPCFELKIIVFNKGEFNGVMFYTRNIHTDFTPIYSTTHMNHVHQLQNLYFALRDEELTYGGNK
jgi:hypothetical protein